MSSQLYSIAKENLSSELLLANEKNAELEEEVKELKVFAAQQLNEGFNTAVEQLMFLNPGLDAREASVFKEVRGGRLVRVDEEEQDQIMETKLLKKK